MKFILYITTVFFLVHTTICAQDANCEDNQSFSKIGYSDEKSDKESYSSYDDIYRFAYQSGFKNDWTIGPNPTYGELNIYGNTEYIQSIELYSITGEMLRWYDGFDIYQSIDLYGLPNGIYFIRIVGKANDVKTYKIVKR